MLSLLPRWVIDPVATRSSPGARAGRKKSTLRSRGVNAVPAVAIVCIAAPMRFLQQGNHASKDGPQSQFLHQVRTHSRLLRPATVAPAGGPRRAAGSLA